MKFTRNNFKIAIVGGIVAQIIFEAYAWLISPLLFGPELQPAKLVMGLFQKYIGIGITYPVAFGIHAFIGAIGFGLFTLLFYKLLNGRPILSGAISGLILWFVAQGILAPAMGREFMMGFGAYTQSSFIAHIGMALIITLFIKWRLSIVRLS